MSDGAEAWLERNNAYLGAALGWLRELLRAAAPPSPNVPLQGEVPSANLPSRVGDPGTVDWANLNPFRRRTPANAVPQVLLLPSASPDADPPALAAAAERLAEASEGDPPPALPMLAGRFGLSDFERDVLLLCIATELDPGIQEAYAAVQGGAGRANPSFALAMTLFDHASWDALSPERALRYWRLIDVNQPGATPLTTAALRADERIVNFAKGLNHLDARVAVLLEAMPADGAALAESHRVLLDQLVRLAGSYTPARIALVGPDRDSKRRLAAAAAAALGLPCYRLSVESIPTGAELDSFLRLWARESLLLPFALHLDAHDLPAGTEQQIRRLVRRAGGLVFVDLRDGMSGLEIDARVDVAKPSATEQRAEWEAQLKGVAKKAEVAARLSSHFDLNFADIAGVARDAHAGEEGTLAERLWRGSIVRARPSLAQLAQRIEVKPSCRDIVLPESEMVLLDQIAAQVRGRSIVYDDWGFRERMNRGLGVSALFAGDSGTGKTMAAETLADRLDLDLYRIDLSAVVSKYIGETEKNLRDVFDAAEAGGAILFFDEADALFGKRSDVKDSHDRYANIEIDYLLQRMEAFAGLAILATNMKSALDPAFVRRLRFIVNFAYPGPAERKRIWEKAFPPGAPLQAVDFDRLAQLDLTGGNIHGVAINAAFMAAAAGSPVTMDLLLDACRIELRKLDRPVNEADFRRIRAVAGETR